MGHKEHIKDENRTIEDFLKIKFYKEGNFWRAYEWSAYLCEFFPNGLSENDKLKPTYKEVKGVDGGIIFLGLPTSLRTKKLRINRKAIDLWLVYMAYIFLYNKAHKLKACGTC